MFHSLGVWCLLVGVAPPASGPAPKEENTGALPAVPYRQAARPHGAIVLEMSPPQGPIPGEGIAVQAATGKRLWRLSAYSPAALVYGGGEYVLLLNAGPVKEKAPAKAWAVGLYRRGREVKEYTFGDLARETKVKVADLLPEKAPPLGWVGRLEGPTDKAKSVTLTLASGWVLRFHAETGKLESANKGDGKPKEAKPESYLAPGYLEALRARPLAAGLNAFALRAHNLAAKAAADDNSVLSPYGMAAALAALGRLTTEAGEKDVAAVFRTAGEKTKGDLLQRYGQLDEVVLGPARSAAWLGLELGEAAKGPKALVVKAVLPGSPLEKFARPGEQVSEVNGKPVATQAAFAKAVEATEGTTLELALESPGGRVQYVQVPFGAASPVALRTQAWVPKASPLGRVVAERLAGRRGVDVEVLDADDTKKAAEGVNARLAALTGGKTADVFKAGDLARKPQLLLSNTLRFSAGWALPFPEMYTDLNGKFHVTREKAVKAAVMKTTLRAACVKDDAGKFTAVELAYRGDRFGFVLVVPDAVGGLRAVEETLARRGVAGVFDALDGSGRWVTLHLPRFQTRRAASWEKVLSEMGLPTTLPLRAGQGGKAGLTARLGDVRQQALVRVDEKGTEAAAVTSLVVGAIGIPPQPVVVKATHPFLFLIRDRSSGAILFIGRVVNPSPAEGG
jgi:serpin B